MAGLLESTLTAGKDSFDQAMNDLARLFGGDLGAAGDIYSKLTAGPAPGKLAIKETAKQLAPQLGPLIDAILQGIQPGNIAAHVPQTYRNLGFQRQGGALSPIDFAAKLMQEGNYPRFKQLVEAMVRRGQGKEFEAFRGFGLNDPLAKAALGGELPPATSVTLRPSIAREFMHKAARVDIPSVAASMKTTPESVLALLPRRGSVFDEAELLIDPRLASSFNIMERRAAKPTADLLQAAIQDVLARPGPRLIPGSGAASLASTEPLPGIVETLKKALGAASQPPMENLY